MVETQLRPNEVTDIDLLYAMGSLPRERFVPPAFERLAYMDEGIPVLPARDGSAARYLLAPMVQARLIQLAEIKRHDEVLDVGCATGYSTIVLARLAAQVTGLEADPELVKAAKENLAGMGVDNAKIVASDLMGGWAAQGPYDAIIVEGGIPKAPKSLLSQLKEGGRLVAVITPQPDLKHGKAYLFVRVGKETSGVARFDVGGSPLPGFAPAPPFSF